MQPIHPWSSGERALTPWPSRALGGVSMAAGASRTWRGAFLRPACPRAWAGALLWPLWSAVLQTPSYYWTLQQPDLLVPGSCSPQVAFLWVCWRPSSHVAHLCQAPR